jgi:hypothetical protein
MPNYKNEHTNRDFLMSHPSSNHRLNCFVNQIEQLKSMIDPLKPQLFNRGTVASVHHDAWLPCEEDGEGEKAQRKKGRRQEEGD